MEQARTSATWEPQREAVAARHRFVSYSQRFRGSSSWPADGDASAEAQVGDLVALIRLLGPEPVHLVGFSSAIGLRVVLREPGLVRSLITIEPNVPWLLEGDPKGTSILGWWRDQNERVRDTAAGDEKRRATLWFELVNNQGPGAFEAQPEALRRMWLDNMIGPRPTPPAADPLTCEQLGTIATPTLAMATEHGMPYSRAIVARLAPCIPDCTLVDVGAVTHFLSYQAPDVFNDLVLDFIGRH